MQRGPSNNRDQPVRSFILYGAPAVADFGTARAAALKADILLKNVMASASPASSG